jgi:hypothetical protein
MKNLWIKDYFFKNTYGMELHVLLELVKGIFKKYFRSFGHLKVKKKLQH